MNAFYEGNNERMQRFLVKTRYSLVKNAIAGECLLSLFSSHARPMNMLWKGWNFMLCRETLRLISKP
jgi:hypothetical protein